MAGDAVAQAPPGSGTIPRRRLSAFYLLHFAVVGCFMPFIGPWLAALGHGAVAIGALVAIMALGRIFAPPLWAWWADSRTRRLPLLRGCLLAATAFFAVLALLPAARLGADAGGASWLLAALLLGYGLCGSGVLPQFEVITLNHLGTAPQRYSVIRLWGSVGFVLAVLLFGTASERLGIGIWPVSVLTLLLASVLLAATLSERIVPRVSAQPSALRAVLRQRQVAGLLLGCLLMQASHGTYYAFYSLYLAEAGYGGTTVGLLWALGVVAEVALFAVMPRLARRFRARSLFLACFALTALRWLMIAAGAGNFALLLVAQGLHAASFGLYHAVAVQCVHDGFRGPLQGRGQALYSSVGFGAGGALGSFGAGLVWASAGPRAAWLVAAAVALLGLLVVWRSGAGRLESEPA